MTETGIPNLAKKNFSTELVSSLKPMFGYIKKQQQNRQFQRTLELTATFALITFFMYFAIRPTFLTISALKGEIESKKIIKEELRKKINSIIIAQDLYSQIQGNYQIVNSALPDRPDYYQSAWEIVSTAGENSVATGNLQFSLETAANSNTGKDSLDPGLGLFSIGVNSTGPFLSLVNTAAGLIDNRRLVNISSLRFSTGIKPDEVSATGTASGQAIINNFNADFYYWKGIQNGKK